jgi:hypothetical protein
MKVITLIFCAGLSLALSQAQDANRGKASHPKKLMASQRAALERAYACGAINGGGALGVPGVADPYQAIDREQYRALRCEELRAQLAPTGAKESKR